MPSAPRPYNRSEIKTSPTRILYVISSLELGGAERHVVHTAINLKRLGWETMIYCIRRRGVELSELKKWNVKLILPPIEDTPVPQSALCQLVYSTLSSIKLLRVMIACRPTIVHFFLPRAYLLGAPLAIIARIPIRIMSRRSLNYYQARWRVARWLEPVLHRHMSRVVGNSNAVVRQLVEQERCQPEKTSLIRSGIDREQIHDRNEVVRQKMREELGMGDDTWVAITVSNLIPYKGHFELLQALKEVSDDLPNPWLVLCVGRDDGILHQLQRLAAEYGIGDNIRFLGLRFDVPDLLQAADVGLLCSHEEGFSNVILEYMAAGLPMIATDVGGNPEAVVDGKTGLLVPDRDPKALAHALVALARDRKRAARMGAAACQRVERCFTSERCIRKYEELYESLLEDLR